VLASLLAACAGRPAPPAPRPEPPADHAYLLAPPLNYPLELDAELAARVAGAHAELVAGGDPAAARAAAAELLAEHPGLHPAAVLAAQAELAAGRAQPALERLAPVVQELPEYLAARLALARAAELVGDVTTAYDAYRGAAASALATRRAAELRPRALEASRRRVEESLHRGRVEDAEAQLAQLQVWAPDEESTLAAAAAVARAAGDSAAELAALRRLRPADRERLERLALLELESGEPGAGVEVYQRLAAEHPGDRQLQARLAAAKFRWRLALLPPALLALGERPALTRGEFAALLYWTVPEVRYGRPAGGRIAADVLDHPQREEIVRVVNLDLMDVDLSLHRFAPDREVRRIEALQALLRLLARDGGRVACLGQGGVVPPREAACGTAADCRLLDDPGDCLPEAPLSGGEALSLLERALDRMPGR
jgi:hypothetical protein